MSGDVLLHGRELSRRFSGGQGVGRVSLMVSPGKTVSLAGPNGSGKTTLLRLLAGLEKPDTGTITLNTPKGGLAPAAAWGWWLGVVSQHSQPWPHMTVLENVRTPLVTVLKATVAEAEQQAVTALARFGLADRLTAMPRELSGGLKQRLVLARAAALRPRVLLLDEVTSALDPEWTHEVGAFIKDFCVNGGAVVQVSHRMGQVRRLSDHVLFLHQGQVLASGRPEEVFHASADPLIQLFLETA